MHATVFFDSDFSVRLTFALLHLLWQGSLVAVLVWIANGCLKRAAARARYLVNLAALGLIVLCLPATFMASGSPSAERNRDVAAAGDVSAADDDRAEQGAIINAAREPFSAAAASAETLASADERELAASELLPVERSKASLPPPIGSLSGWVQRAAPYATVAYFVGVLAMLVRLAIALWGGQRLRSASQPVSDETLQAMIRRVAARVSLKTAPAVAWCQRVTVPVVVGVVRPLVLLPASLANGLVPDQIESLLTHELAHIRRHDLWVNLLQRLIEAVFFFHPAVWYVSRCVSAERENCCDDSVLSAGWPRMQYADALVRMAELCLAARSVRLTPQAMLPQPTLLAASGESQSQFKRRVLRLLGQEPSPSLLLNRTGVLGLVVGIAALLAAPLVVRTFANAAPGVTEGQSDDAPLAAATAPTDAWPQWGGSARRNHVSFVTGLPVTWDVGKRVNVKWVAQLGSATYSSPIVAGDKVLIGTNNAAGRLARFPKTTDLSCLQCFDKATGRFLWQFSSQKLPSGRANDWPSIGLCASPCVEGDRAWLVTNRCEVVCLDLRTRDSDDAMAAEKSIDEPNVVWRTDLIKLGVHPFCQAASSVTLAGELVLFNTSNGVDESHNEIPAPEAPSFVALNRDTGRVVWSDASPGGNLLPVCPSASPAVAELGGVWQAIFCGGDGWLYSFDVGEIRRGKTTLLWKFDANPKAARWQPGGKGDRNTLIASPTVYQNRVYIVTGRCPEDGEGPAHLWCIDPTKRGDLSAELVFNRADPTKPIAPKRWQACDAAAGDFTRANANSGVIWHYESSDLNGNGRHDFDETLHRAIGSVSVANGLALVADLNGILYCLDARTGHAYWSHDLRAAVWSTPFVADGRIYVADVEGSIHVFRLAKKKEVLAEFNTEDAVFGSFAAADGSLFLATSTKLLAIAKPSSAAQGAADWPSFRGGTQARGTSAVELPGKPELLWKQICTVDGKTGDGKTGVGNATSGDRDSFEATAAIVGGTVFVGSREGTLYALDLATGAKKWGYKDVASFSTPAVQGGWVYVGDSDGTLHCLNAVNGNQKWTFAATAAIAAGPNFHKDRVIFGSQDASLYCVDAASGKLIWKHTIGDQIRSFPTIEGNRIFIAGCDSKLHVINADSGKRVEEIELDGATGCTPAVVGNRLFVGTEEGKFFGIDWREGKIAWTYEQPNRAAGYRSSPAATEDVVIVGSRARTMIGLNPMTGKLLWTFNAGSAIDGSPVIADGRAYFGSSRGRLHALDIKTGRQVWEYAAGSGFPASPAVASGKLVIASDDGVVYCFGAKAPDTPSPKADAAAPQPKVAERNAEPSVETRLTQRVSLKVTDQPLIFVLDELERKHHVPVTIDLRAFRDKRIDPHTRISVDQKEITVREAFRQVLSPVGLEFEVTATGIRVPPAPKAEAPAPKAEAPAPAPKAEKTATDSARISVKYDIPDADAEAKIYVQHVGGRGDIGSESYGPMKWSPLKNGGTLELKDLAAGDYQVARYRQVEIGRVGMSRVHSGLYLDRRQFSLKRGEAIAIDFARPKGRSVSGRVLGLKEAKLEQAVVCICSDDAKDDGSLDNLKVVLFDARLCDKEGAFQTERLAPGKYAVLAQGYEPLTEESLKFSGIIRPRYLGVARFTVPETGDLPTVEVSLRDSEAKAKTAKTEQKAAAKPDRATSIAFNVLDRTGQKGISSFRVIPGHRPKEGDQEKPVWDRGAARAGKDGGLLWPLADLDDREWAFLVEAEGHDSQFWAWIKKAKGPQFLVFLMAETAKAGQTDKKDAENKGGGKKDEDDKPKEDAKTDEGVKKSDDVKKRDAWGDLTVRLVYDGPRPKLDRLPVIKDSAVFGRDVQDESLLVGEGGGLANVIVFLTSKDVPVHPEERKKSERPAEMKVSGGLFQPRVLLVQAGQKVTLNNPAPLAVNFHVQSNFDVPVNLIVPAKGDRQVEFRRAERLPVPVQDNLHPWIRAYLFPLGHPYAAVSGNDGVARLRNLPAGEWTFRLWHEKVGYLKNPGGSRDFVFRIDPKGSGAEYRVSPEFALKPAERREEKKPTGSESPTPKSSAPKSPAPKTDTKPAEPKQSEETKRALSEFKKRYALADGEDLKFIPAPTPESRLIYLRENCRSCIAA